MTKYIAIIDASLTVRKILEVSLGRAGYHVASWSNPGQALRVLFSPYEIHPDLLFVELNLPHLDGFEVIKQVRASKRYARLPVIVISGRNGVLDRVKARVVGANAFIEKPFKVQEVVALVHAFLSREPPRNLPLDGYA